MTTKDDPVAANKLSLESPVKNKQKHIPQLIRNPNTHFQASLPHRLALWEQAQSQMTMLMFH